MTDFDTPIAQLKFLMDGDAYRIKIFTRFLTLERQPGGINKRLYFHESDFAGSAYIAPDSVWDFDCIRNMIIVEYRETESYVEKHVAEKDIEIEAKQAKFACTQLPTMEDIKAKNARANGRFIVRYDGGGEYILLFIDGNGTISGRPGEPVERLIHTFKDTPTPEESRARAVAWLEANYSWL